MLNITFIDLLSRLINHRLQKFADDETSLNGTSLQEIHKVIKEAVYEVLQKCEFTLDDVSKRYITQLLFKSLSIRSKEGEVDLQSHYLMNEIKPSELNTADLRIIRGLFHESDWEEEIDDELRKRT